ncbi:hypothetical protein EIB75_10560 [Epilithonimonas vandammei]|uniref:Cell wall anchor protein n=1 Tax=Epilithonimonas vandammei TaxID=2487072 RepID=A0A3G8ZMD2_9FLAO|nr:hypothetical protein [Epilithonimonas vandammei]AZI53916.1 hypothetical protein EIB75_00980 [Epilithonimonas vandammei]AZI55664.1 hypothetical protein EIB75_10560 [Epilithonimonas vandammei]
MNSFFTEHIAPHIGMFFSAILTGVAGFMFGRKKMDAEVTGLNAENEGKEIENADKLVKLYKDAIDDLGSRYEVKFREVTSMYESKVKLLEDEINLHKRINAQLKEENTMLRKKIKDSGIIL